MRKNTFYSWTLLVVVIGGLTLIYQSSAKNKDIFVQYDSANKVKSSTSKTIPVNNTIIYENNIFSPSVINIKTGTRMTFSNNSNLPLRIVSDSHPDHSNLPSFDSIIFLNRGETYDYTFNNSGTWGYHNETNPSETGTIIVE